MKIFCEYATLFPRTKGGTLGAIKKEKDNLQAGSFFFYNDKSILRIHFLKIIIDLYLNWH
jgi:hypothetical protein